MGTTERIQKRLKAITAKLLGETALSEDELRAYSQELKSLRELIATWRALDSAADLGMDDESPSPQQRKSDQSWD